MLEKNRLFLRKKTAENKKIVLLTFTYRQKNVKLIVYDKDTFQKSRCKRQRGGVDVYLSWAHFIDNP